MAGFELGTDGPGTILTAVDRSITSLRAGAYAAGLARRQHAHLLVVTVATTSALAAMAPGALPVLTDAARELAADVQGEARRYLDDLALTGELVARQGDPYTEIVRLADERREMARHRRSLAKSPICTSEPRRKEPTVTRVSISSFPRSPWPPV